MFAAVRESCPSKRSSAILWPKVRAIVWLLPPGGKGTRKRMGLVGQGCAAAAYVQARSPAGTISFSAICMVGIR